MSIIDVPTGCCIALTILAGAAFLKYSGYMDRVARGVGFAVAAAFFLFLDAATSIGFWNLNQFVQAQYILCILFGAIAWILLLIAAFMITGSLIKSRV